MNTTPKIKTQRLEIRLAPENKKKIERYALKCGLSTSEYVTKRALGFTPRTVLHDAFFDFYGKLCEICNYEMTPETEAKLLTLIDEIYSEILSPKKEVSYGVPAKRNTLCGEKEHSRIGEPFDTCGKSDRKECNATWLPQDSGP